MRSSVSNTAVESKQTPPNQAEEQPFFVPEDRTALVVRDGVPEQFVFSGLHPLPKGQAKVEVRLLSPEVSRLPALVPPDSRALNLPYERSYLHIDGALVGILEPARSGAEAGTPEIKAWEGFNPFHKAQERYLESLTACLDQPLRACYPTSGICCGGRMAS